MKRTVLFTIVLCFSLTVAWADQSSKAGDKESMEITVPRMATASALDDERDDKGGAIRLLASDSSNTETLFEPTNVTVVSVYDTPVLVSVSLPKDKHRTHLLISAGAAHDWTQIPSAAPYLMGGSFQFFLSSTALPPPGQMRIRIPLADSQRDFQPSTVEISRIRDPGQTFGLDEKVMAFLVKGNFPTLTDEQALQTARALLKSNVLIEMKMQVKLQSVREFGVGGAGLQVYGD